MSDNGSQNREEKTNMRMPPAICREVRNTFFKAAALAVITVFMAIATRSWLVLIGLVFSAFLIYFGITLIRDTRAQEVQELTLICTEVYRTPRGSAIKMKTPAHAPAKYRKFFYPSWFSPFREGGVYRLYVSKDNPHSILCFETILSGS